MHYTDMHREIFISHIRPARPALVDVIFMASILVKCAAPGAFTTEDAMALQLAFHAECGFATGEPLDATGAAAARCAAAPDPAGGEASFAGV